MLETVAGEEHADLLEEHFVHNKSFRQLAKERGVSHEAIANRVHKLLDLLQTRLNHENA
jgi:transcriptional regulator of aromatic amino acid metabolism